MHWELAVSKDGGTITEKSFDSIEDAISSLINHPDDSAFLDLWEGTKELNQTISKKSIVDLFK